MGELIHLHGPEPQSLDAWRETRTPARLKHPALSEYTKALYNLVQFVDPDDRRALLEASNRYGKAIEALAKELEA